MARNSTAENTHLPIPTEEQCSMLVCIAEELRWTLLVDSDLSASTHLQADCEAGLKICQYNPSSLIMQTPDTLYALVPMHVCATVRNFGKRRM